MTFVASALVALARTGGAQQATTPDSIRKTPVAFAYSALDYASFGSADLDARFVAAGLPKVGRAASTVGIGADLRYGRWMAGAGLQSMLARSSSAGAYRTRIAGSYSLFDVGFALVSSAKLAIYPVAGVGVTRLSLNVRERGDFDFDDGLGTPRRELTLSGTSAMVHAGVLIERRFHRADSEFGISLRIGVTQSVGSQSWQSDESKVSGGPAGVGGRYARIAFSRSLSSRRDATLPLLGTIARTLLN